MSGNSKKVLRLIDTIYPWIPFESSWLPCEHDKILTDSVGCTATTSTTKMKFHCRSAMFQQFAAHAVNCFFIAPTLDLLPNVKSSISYMPMPLLESASKGCSKYAYLLNTIISLICHPYNVYNNVQDFCKMSIYLYFS